MSIFDQYGIVVHKLEPPYIFLFSFCVRLSTKEQKQGSLGTIKAKYCYNYRKMTVTN